jgi:hypothetical protein
MDETPIALFIVILGGCMPSQTFFVKFDDLKFNKKLSFSSENKKETELQIKKF